VDRKRLRNPEDFESIGKRIFNCGIKKEELARGERREEGAEKLCTETPEMTSFEVENEICERK
jgi:hypothetical protein